MSDFLTTQQLATYLQVSEIKLAQDRARGLGPPFVRMGRSIRYERDAVDAWITTHTVQPLAKE